MFFVTKINQFTLFIYLISVLMIIRFVVYINEFTNHYVYIKDFNRLMFNKTRHKSKKYFCKS